MRTPEQVEADDALNEAIDRWAAAYDLIGNGELITNWVMVTESVSVDMDGSHRYNIGVRNNSVPMATALGLLSIGENHVWGEG